MKQAILGFMFLVVALLTVCTMFSIHSKDARTDEIEKNLTKTAEQALEQTLNNKVYKIEDAKELVADFVQNLILGVNSDSDISIKVIDIDYDNGLINIEITENFKYVNGNKGSVTIKKALVVN